jgi:hypothetical protein
MRSSFEALRAAKAPWADAFARATALQALGEEVYRFRLVATELSEPAPVLLGPPVGVASVGYEADKEELDRSRPDMQHASTRAFVGKAKQRLAHLQDLAAELALATPSRLLERVQGATDEAELLGAVMALDDLLTGRNDAMAPAMEALTEKEVAAFRARFVSAMVKHQIDDKANDAPSLDHVWSALVEKCFYATQTHFELFAGSRPKRLFVDYVVALEKAATPPAFAEAMEEVVWWCQRNLPQDPTTWHSDFIVYVDEVGDAVARCVEALPRLLAPDALGESPTLRPHQRLLDETNRYRGYHVSSLWWAKLGQWRPVPDEDGTIAYFERGDPEGGDALEYSYVYPVPPEPGKEHEEAEFAYEIAEGAYEGTEGAEGAEGEYAGGWAGD